MSSSDSRPANKRSRVPQPTLPWRASDRSRPTFCRALWHVASTKRRWRRAWTARPGTLSDAVAEHVGNPAFHHRFRLAVPGGDTDRAAARPSRDRAIRRAAGIVVAVRLHSVHVAVSGDLLVRA